MAAKDRDNGSAGGSARKLATLGGVRKLLADTLRAYDADQINAEKCRTMAYSCRVLADVIKDQYQLIEMQKAMRDLEAQVAELRAARPHTDA